MIEYSTFTPLLPPRPEASVSPSLIGTYERMGWRTQVKKNGQYSVVYVSPEKEVIALNRHLEPHKNWSWTKDASAIFKKLPGKGWYVLCAELLGAKVTNGPKDVHYVHDVLVDDGKWLVGETYASRYKRLQSLFLKKSPNGSTPSYWELDDHTWLARNQRDGAAVYESLTSLEDEGIVLKDPNAVLSRSNKWSVKVRRPTKNFSF